MTKIGITFALFLSIFSLQISPAFAQGNQTKEEKKAIKVKEKIRNFGTGEKAKIKVKLYNKSSYQGYVRQTGEDNFVVVDATGGSTTVRYTDVDSIGGKNLSTGAKIAIGIGIGAGATLAILFAIVASLD